MERERNVYKRAKTESRMHEGDEERRECVKPGAKVGASMQMCTPSMKTLKPKLKFLHL